MFVVFSRRQRLDQLGLGREMASAGAKHADSVSHVRADGVKRVDFASGIGADVAVGLFGPLTQLGDITQHQHLAAVEAFEQVDGGADGGLVGVIGVVDHAHAVAGQLRHGAPLDRLHRTQTCGDTEQRHAQGVRGSGSGQGIGDVMVAQQIQLHVFIALWGVQGKGRAATRINGNVGGVEIGRGVEHGKRQDLATRGAYTPGFEGLVVEIQHSGARGIEAFKDFALGFDDFLRATELANVGGTGIIDDRHVGLGQRHGVGDFADARCAQLDHGSGVFRGQFKQGQRSAEIIIQVATGRENRAACTQHTGEQFLDRGLAAGAGDGCNRLVKGRTVQRTQLTQGQAGIGNQQLWQCGIRHFALHQGADGTFGGDVIQVVVTIKTRARQGDKQLPWLDGAAVDTDAVETAIARQHAGRQGLGQFAEFHCFKHGRPPRRSRRDRPRPDRKRRGAHR